MLYTSVQQKWFSASLQTQEISWFGYNRGWVLLSLRVVQYFPQATVGERKRARKFTFREKGDSRKEERKKGSLTGCWKDYCWFAFVFGVVILPCPFQRFLGSFFFICFFFPSSSTKGHRKCLPFILFVRWGYLIIKLCKSVLKFNGDWGRGRGGVN